MRFLFSILLVSIVIDAFSQSTEWLEQIGNKSVYYTYDPACPYSTPYFRNDTVWGCKGNYTFVETYSAAFDISVTTNNGYVGTQPHPHIIDKLGNIWQPSKSSNSVYGKSGISRYDVTNDRYFVFNKANGMLPSDSVLTMVMDTATGTLWFICGTELMTFDYTNGFRVLDINNSPFDRYWRPKNLHISNKNTVYVGLQSRVFNGGWEDAILIIKDGNWKYYTPTTTTVIGNFSWSLVSSHGNKQGIIEDTLRNLYLHSVLNGTASKRAYLIGNDTITELNIGSYASSTLAYDDATDFFYSADNDYFNEVQRFQIRNNTYANTSSITLPWRESFYRGPYFDREMQIWHSNQVLGSNTWAAVVENRSSAIDPTPDIGNEGFLHVLDSNVLWHSNDTIFKYHPTLGTSSIVRLPGLKRIGLQKIYSSSKWYINGFSDCYREDSSGSYVKYNLDSNLPSGSRFGVPVSIDSTENLYQFIANTNDGFWHITRFNFAGLRDTLVSVNKSLVNSNIFTLSSSFQAWKDINGIEWFKLDSLVYKYDQTASLITTCSTRIYYTPDDNLYTHSAKKLLQFDGTTWVSDSFFSDSLPHVALNSFGTVYLDKFGVLWVVEAQTNNNGGIYLYRKANNHWDSYYFGTSYITYGEPLLDDLGAFWLPTSTHLIKFDSGNFTYYPYSQMPASTYPNAANMYNDPYNNRIGILGGVWFNPYQTLGINYSISGNVYYDYNANGVRDANEPNLQGQKVILLPDSAIAYTDANGLYAFPANSGNYEVVLVPDSAFVVVGSDTLPVLLNANIPARPNIDFGLTYTQPSYGLRVMDGGDHTVGCVRGYNRDVVLKNTGNQPALVNVKLWADTAIGVNSFAPGGITLNDTLYYQALPLSFFSQLHLSIDYAAAGAPAPQAIKFYYQVELLDTQGNYLNTYTDSIARGVTCSFDPNDKWSYSMKSSPDDYTLYEDALTYNIRFQNTGNDTAYRVIIRDTLSNLFDPGSFQLLTSSHSVNAMVEGQNLVFDFRDINLVDSTTNEPLSHGYVTFKVSLQGNIPHGTEVLNRAAIYFDINAPIITNDARNVIVYCDSINAFSLNKNHYCVGDTLTASYTGIGATSWLWEFGSQQDSTITNVSPVVSGAPEVLYLTTKLLDCTVRDSIIFAIDTLPSKQLINLTGIDSLCNSGGAVMLQASNSSSYNWYHNGVLQPSVAAGYTVTVPGTYFAQLNNNGCNVYSDTVVIGAFPMPVSTQITIQGKDTLCILDTTVLAAPAGFAQYLWQNGETGNQLMVVSPGIFTVELVDSFGCLYADTTAIAQYPAISYRLPNDTALCYNQSVTINLNTQLNYQWVPASAVQVSGSQANVSSSNSIDLLMTATDGNGCEALDTMAIAVNAPVTVTAGDDTTVCAGGTVSLSTVNNYAVTWYGNASISSANSSVTTALVSTPGYIYLLGVDSLGCEGIDSLYVDVHPTPSISVNQLSDTLYASGGSSYQWMLDGVAINGATNNTYLPLVSGEYTVEATDANTCKAISNPISVIISGLGNLPLDRLYQVYPNPFAESLIIARDSNSGLPWNGALYDMAGKLLLQFPSTTNSSLTIQTEILPQGTYIIEVVENGNKQYLQVVKH